MGCRELSIREKFTLLRSSRNPFGNGTDYTTNELNQYTSLTSLPSVQNPSYDDDGNMLTATLGTPSPSSAWSYTWNAENRLITAVNGTTTLEFKYDYQGRRVEKKVIENGTQLKMNIGKTVLGKVVNGLLGY